MNRDRHDSDEDLSAALFEFAPDAIVVADAAGRVVRVNAQAERLFGYPREELVGQPVEMLVPDRFRSGHVSLREHYASRPRTRRMGEGQRLYGLRRDGSEVAVEIALAPIHAADGSLVLTIIRDITRRQETEDALQRAHDELEARVRTRTEELEEANRRLVHEQAQRIQTEKLSSIGLLASGVAHEINNPLSGVMGLVKAIRDGSADEREREAFFDAVQEGLDRIRASVRGLLNFARQQPPTPELIDVADACAACARLVGPAASGKQVEVELRARPGESFVHADRSQLMQAIVNVLLNAIHAAPPGTIVSVGVATERTRTGIRIEDRGNGIPAAIMDKVCDPFFTTKPEGVGTGLGLAVTLNIVRAHGGELAIESEAGHGAAVTLWLPAPESEGGGGADA